MEPRRGRQTPTRAVTLPYSDTRGQQAVELYQTTGRTAQEWQQLLIYDILAENDEGLVGAHQVRLQRAPAQRQERDRRHAGAVRPDRGEHILHTAHRTTTSSASRRLAALLDAAGYTEVSRLKKGAAYDWHYTYSKQLGLERSRLLGAGGGACDFRTRSAKGGLGEGFNLLVIDEAQEDTEDQESALKYVVTDSRNPQSFCLVTLFYINRLGGI